jgi:hypothetical protein
VADNNVIRLVGSQDFLNLRVAIFVSPTVVTGKP